MALRFLLDTSALWAHFRREPGWNRVQELFEAPETEVLASSLSLTEFARRLRVLGATREEARSAAEAYRELVNEVVPVDEEVALAAFDLACEISERLPLADSLIAAAARVRGACLVHRDQHMVSIPARLVEQIDLSAEPSEEAESSS